MTDLKPIMVTVPEAMRLLGIGRSTAYSLIKAKKLDLVHIGRRSLVTVASIDRFTASLNEAP